jgi:hypothetical protein
MASNLRNNLDNNYYMKRTNTKFVSNLPINIFVHVSVLLSPTPAAVLRQA